MSPVSSPASVAQPPGATVPPVRSVYQPIVHLLSGEVVAYEALARGPQGSALESPGALFDHARAHDLESMLDIHCQAAAMRGALKGRLPASVPVFVNAEPRWLASPWPKELAPIAHAARQRLQVVVELTERSLVDDPARLLAEVRRLRDVGCGVALDDVGAEPASLALMPFIDPDVIKLDLRLVQERTTAEIAGIANAVMAQAERSDALVLAEGIETDEHRQRAMAMGAVLGQGWLLGRPGPLPQRLPGGGGELSFTRGAEDSHETPFELLRRYRPLRTTTKSLLLPMSRHLESAALDASTRPVLLSAFQERGHFAEAIASRYERLAERCAFVGVFALGMDAEPVAGVRGVPVGEDDRLRQEWAVCVVGPHFAGALAARDLGDTGPQEQRRFEFVITHDRELVLQAARSLLVRIGLRHDTPD